MTRPLNLRTPLRSFASVAAFAFASTSAFAFASAFAFLACHSRRESAFVFAFAVAVAFAFALLTIHYSPFTRFPRFPRPTAHLSTAALLLALPASAQTLRIEGDRALAPALQQWNALFARTHPGVRVQLHLADSSIALGGLTAGTADLALTTRSAWETELRPFRFVFGYPPADVRIARIFCLTAGRGTAPPAVYINTRNPLRGLTAQQVAQIFTAGQPAGDITQGAQLNLPGDFATRALHVYGLRDDGSFATEVRAEYMRIPGQPALLTPDTPLRYEPLATPAAVLHALALDPFGIALLDTLPTTALPPNVHMVPLATDAAAPFSSATCTDVAAARYPFSPFVHLYLNHPPHSAPNQLLHDYLALILSPAGQQVLNRLTPTTELLPLTPAESSAALNHLP